MAGARGVAFLAADADAQPIRELRGVTTGLNDTMRWAVGQVRRRAAPLRVREAPRRRRAPRRTAGRTLRTARTPACSPSRPACGSRYVGGGRPAGGTACTASSRRPRYAPSPSRCSPRSSSRGRSAPARPAARTAPTACATASRASAIARPGCRARWRGSVAWSARRRARSRSSSGAWRRSSATSTRRRRSSTETVTRRDKAMARALRLRKRLAQSRSQLAKLLRERYTGGRPDVADRRARGRRLREPARDGRLPQAHPALGPEDPRRRAHAVAARRSCSAACSTRLAVAAPQGRRGRAPPP